MSTTGVDDHDFDDEASESFFRKIGIFCVVLPYLLWEIGKKTIYR